VSPRSRRAWGPHLVAVALACAFATQAAAESRVYRPQQRLASELLSLAEAALAGEGRAVADAGTNSLVLVGPAAALARALELLAAQDRALRNVVVHYESQRVDELASEGVRVDWQVVAGDLRVGNLLRPARDSSVSVRPEAGSGRVRGGSQGMLRVLEGQSGRIAAGVELPVTLRTRTAFGVREESSLVEVASGFEVTPHVMGDGRVRLDLAPFDDRVAGSVAGGPVVRRSGSQTSITLAPGEKIAIGGLARDSASERGDLTSGTRNERAREENVTVVWVELD
jgi:type II secretory pathway component GspD/PulD (secretin)